MKAILKNFNQDADIQIQVSGKWILAGEHTVLRGGQALVFPLKSRYLKLNYLRAETDFEMILNGENHPEIELMVWSVLERALKKIGLKRSALKGILKFESKILFGSGMGASATLCVALTRWLHQMGYLPEKDQYEFARDLENLFHGESSGVDVAVTLYNCPLLFSRNDGFQLLQNYPKPKLYLSHTGAWGVTKDCVDQVKKILVQDRKRGEAIDEQMKQAVAQFQVLLQQNARGRDGSNESVSERNSNGRRSSYSHNHSENEIDSQAWIRAMGLAHQCFRDWGLVNEAVRLHEEQLLQAGAQAVKLTGSGGGGFMLSYWTEPPPADVTFEMIPCFNEA